MIQGHVLYNKALRADWKGRETTVLTLLRDIVASEPGIYKWFVHLYHFPCYTHFRFCARVNPSSCMSRGGFIHHAELTLVFDGPHHSVQGERFCFRYYLSHANHGAGRRIDVASSPRPIGECAKKDL